MSKNKIIYTTENLLKTCFIHSNTKDIYIVKLDGQEIPNALTFIDIMIVKFNLKDKHRYRAWEGTRVHWSAFDDRMTELSWFPENTNFALIIYNFKDFMREDAKGKQDMLEVFEYILYFWETEVLTTVVNGKTKEFNIYLVD